MELNVNVTNTTILSTDMVTAMVTAMDTAIKKILNLQ
jgi:hypothetical protein